MQKDKSPTDEGISSSASPESQDQRLQSPHQQYEGIGFTSLCSSSFPTKATFSNSASPSGCSSDEDKIEAATDYRLYLARVSLEYDQLVGRYRISKSHLHEALKEAEALRRENAQLRIAYRDLSNRLRLLTEPSPENLFIPTPFPSSSIIEDFRRLCLGDHNTVAGRVSGELLDVSPTSVIGNNPFDRRNLDRVSIPKSISIRSSGYLKLNQTNGTNGSSSSTSRLRVSTPVDGGTELEAFNQGMFKTELCNKWQETGTCPYGDHCQFAHGISELRPVIRHPRYKTEVCRMVLAGDMCPYGHRCHFRHALTEEERFMGPAL